MRRCGFGRRNTTEVIIMKELDDDGRKAHVKKLWESDPIRYLEWKNECIELNRLPDFFGTRDAPIFIDESRL